MSQDLLDDYNRELAYLRQLGAEFAVSHEKLAKRLRLGPDSVPDPHVERLIQSVAFLNARIRTKLDDDFPELTDALLSVLYPHYLAPVPSMAIVQLECDSELTAAYKVPRGALLDSEPVEGEPCRFRTAYPTEVWPLKVSAASLTGVPFEAPAIPGASKCTAVLRIALDCAGDQALFSELAPGSLRFFLKGQAPYIHTLYELIFDHVVRVAVATRPDDPKPLVLAPSCLTQVGFGEDEALLPYPQRSFPGYRLLTEFFAYEDKFLFVDIKGLEPKTKETAGGHLELFLYLDQTSGDLEQTVKAETFALGCTPIVNLFPRRAEPIRLVETEPEYRVVPDARRPLGMEVYSVDRVSAHARDGDRVNVLPFYGIHHGRAPSEREIYWFAARRPAPATAKKRDGGSEVFLRLVDLDFRPSAPADWVADLEITCTNRDLPGALPFGGGHPRLFFAEGGGAVRKIRCLAAPTQTRRPPSRQGAMWRLVSHLSLNHLSISGGEDGTAALREILSLYDFGSEATRAMIQGVLSVRSKPALVRLVSGGHPAFCRGTEIDVHLDEKRFAGSGLFLFACVLERFLGLYCAANSFVRMSLTTTMREGARPWPPRAGDRSLV